MNSTLNRDIQNVATTKQLHSLEATHGQRMPPIRLDHNGATMNQSYMHSPIGAYDNMHKQQVPKNKFIKNKPN